MIAVPTPAEVQAALDRAAATRDTNQRASGADRVARAYQELLDKARHADPGATAVFVGARSGKAFRSSLETDLIRNDDPAGRRVAALRLASVYSEAYRSASVIAEAGTVYGGRSGGVAFVGAASFLKANPELSELVGVVVGGGVVAVPPGAGPECEPVGYRIDARKPGGTVSASAAGLDPAFVQHLRRAGQSSLVSLEAWSAERGSDPELAATQAEYAQDLAAAWEDFEKQLFENRYCRPSDLPAPNIYRGYRLLRLDAQLCASDFRPQSAQPSQSTIYEGLLGPAAPPEIDYVELIRRYVEQLRHDAAPASRPVATEEIVAALVGSGFSPDRISLFVQASELAMHLHDLRFWEGIRAGGAGAPTTPGPSAPGPGRLTPLPPPTLPSAPVVFPPGAGAGAAASGPAAWLLGSSAQTLRSAIERLWQSVLPVPVTGTRPALDPAVPQAALPVSDLRKHLHSLCVLPDDPLDYYAAVQPGQAYQQNLEAAHRAFGDKLRSLASKYGEVWAAARQVLGQSGLQQRMLSEPRIEFGPQEFEAFLLHVARYAAFESPPNYNQRVYRPAAAELSDNVTVPVSYADLESILQSLGASYQERMSAWVERMVDSYANALDVLLTLTSPGSPSVASGTAPPPATGPAPLTQADIPSLYSQWAQLFWRVIEQLLATRLPLGDRLLVLRLGRRPGRFGEVPRRPQSGEVVPEPKNIPWPGHPRVQTESWMLEPIPKRYYMKHHPGIYLQELHALSLRSRGFGIGRNLYSVSLLPEEEQKIVVKSFKDTSFTITESTAENIFEESSSETERDFGDEIMRESERESTSEEAGHVGAKVSAGVPFFSGSVDASYDAKSGARDFAKDVSKVTSRLATKLSAKRSVSVETKRSTEQTVELHQELNTERLIKNPNLGHTVTFHWFQMTRKYLQQLELEDARLVYTSGKYNFARVFVPRGGAVPAHLQPHQELVTELPAQIAALLPPDVAIAIMTDPYREVLPMSGANAFLARVLTPGKAAEVSSSVWRLLGESDSAPDGLGVLAFSEPHGQGVRHDSYVELFSADPAQSHSDWAPDRVVSDRVRVTPKWDPGASEMLHLPNLDLRFRLRDGQAPARYSATPYDPKSLPRLLAAEERVLATNGVYCDAMVGQCTALEDYLQRHRDLDLLEKKIQVGQQELGFRWAVAKDSLDVVLREDDQSLLAVVAERPGQAPFEERLDVERAQLAERKRIADDQLERQRMEVELEMLRKQVEQAQARIGRLPEVKIDAPQGSSIAVQANVNVDSDAGDGAAVTVE
jgi:hypothetical protein